MNQHLLAQLARERRQAVRDDFARGPFDLPLRPLIARALRATGDRLFRLGVALDPRVSCGATVETPIL